MGITSKDASVDSLDSNTATDKWLTSKEAMQHFGISGCELMHKRVSGELEFKKQGNAYLYLLDNRTDKA